MTDTALLGQHSSASVDLSKARPALTRAVTWRVINADSPRQRAIARTHIRAAQLLSDFRAHQQEEDKSQCLGLVLPTSRTQRISELAAESSTTMDVGANSTGNHQPGFGYSFLRTRRAAEGFKRRSFTVQSRRDTLRIKQMVGGEAVALPKLPACSTTEVPLHSAGNELRDDANISQGAQSSQVNVAVSLSEKTILIMVQEPLLSPPRCPVC